MDEESRQKKLLILLAAVLCAVMIGYNAFYVPDATVAWARSSSPLSGVPASVPAEGEQTSVASMQPESPEPPDSSRPFSSQTAVASRTGHKININTASAQELSGGLDGVGDVLAGRIVEYREKNGPFRSIEEIKNVSGIGDKIFEKIRGSVTVS